MAEHERNNHQIKAVAQRKPHRLAFITVCVSEGPAATRVRVRMPEHRAIPEQHCHHPRAPRGRPESQTVTMSPSSRSQEPGARSQVPGGAESVSASFLYLAHMLKSTQSEGTRTVGCGTESVPQRNGYRPPTRGRCEPGSGARGPEKQPGLTHKRPGCLCQHLWLFYRAGRPSAREE